MLKNCSQSTGKEEEENCITFKVNQIFHIYAGGKNIDKEHVCRGSEKKFWGLTDGTIANQIRALKFLKIYINIIFLL